MAFSQLPEDILEKIATEHLRPSYSQLATLSGVCTSWRSVAHKLYNCRRRGPILPAILSSRRSYKRTRPPPREDRWPSWSHSDSSSSSDDDDTAATTTRRPYHQIQPISSIFKTVAPPRRWSPPNCQTTRRMNLHREDEQQEEEAEIELGFESIPPSSSKIDLQKVHWVAYKDGWSVIVRPRGSRFPPRIYLLNPVTGAFIPLPPLPSDGFKPSVKRPSHTLLSSSPEDDDCHVIIFSHWYGAPRVAWCKVVKDGGQFWNFTNQDLEFHTVESASYFGGRLYAVDSYKRCVYVFFDDPIRRNDNSAAIVVKSFAFSPINRHNYYYLSSQWTSVCHSVELDGHLIIIHHYDGAFQAYKLVLVPHEEYRYQYRHDWEEVRTLDGHAVFLGTHHSFCIPTNDVFNFKGDHIYYITYRCGQCDSNSYDHVRYDYSRGIFSLEDQKLIEEDHWRHRNYRDYAWFFPRPRNILEHMKKYTIEGWKRDHRLLRASTSDNHYGAIYSAAETINRKYQQQLRDSRVKQARNKFQALSLTDDEE